MDIEKAIEFILNQHAKTEARMARLNERAEKWESRLEKSEGRLEKTEALLRRATRASVQEARDERKRRHELNEEFDKKMTQLAAAQLITEEKVSQLTAAQLVTEQKLQGFIDSLRLGGNGHS